MLPLCLLTYLAVGPTGQKWPYIFQLYVFPGHVLSDFTSKHGEPQVHKTWHANGQLASLWSFDENGSNHGRWARWQRDGTLVVDGEFRDHSPWHGTFELREHNNENTKPRYVVEFDRGVPKAASNHLGPLTGAIADNCGEVYHFEDGVFSGERSRAW